MEEPRTVIFRSTHPLVPLRYKDGPARPVSWGGMSFDPDERGVLMLPVEAVRELTESHGMEGVPDHAVRYEDEPAAVTASVLDPLPPPTRSRRVFEAAQTKDGGAVRPAVFPPGGDYPDGGAQPSLTEKPDEKAIQAAQSEAR